MVKNLFCSYYDICRRSLPWGPRPRRMTSVSKTWTVAPSLSAMEESLDRSLELPSSTLLRCRVLTIIPLFLIIIPVLILILPPITPFPLQSAILGMHGVFDRPVVRNGQVS